ncbi:DUF6518 family protein [Actinoplanes rectilineatus]|uniref:DUF6518 family protein n=1 Tax=Actinoplanes rectilineatus TaxID=113571 RepID=UPI0005F2AA44|nr:DUF6518 family protein [Actinoplanes rectilineatus]
MWINRPIVVAPVVGFLLGALDFVWIKFVPFPFGGLGNSIAVWAVAAFLLTFLSRHRMVPAVAGAVGMLIVAVPAYYLAAWLIQNDDLANMWSDYARLWMGLGVVAGIVFGLGGVLARTAGRWRVPAMGLPASVLFAEAVIDLARIGDPSYRTGELVEYAVLLATLGVLTTVFVVRKARENGKAVAVALACAVPLAAGGHVLLNATGFQ